MRVGLTGCNLVGQSLSRNESQSFCAINPTNNKSLEPFFFVAGNEEIHGALEKATAAFPVLQEKSGSEIGLLLREIKNELELNAKIILMRYQLESELHIERAQIEFNRTLLQIDQFIELAESSSWREPSIDAPQNRSLITPDLRKMNVGIGPVLVFVCLCIGFAARYRAQLWLFHDHAQGHGQRGADHDGLGVCRLRHLAACLHAIQSEWLTRGVRQSQ